MSTDRQIASRLRRLHRELVGSEGHRGHWHYTGHSDKYWCDCGCEIVLMGREVVEPLWQQFRRADAEHVS